MKYFVYRSNDLESPVFGPFHDVVEAARAAGIAPQDIINHGYDYYTGTNGEQEEYVIAMKGGS